MLAAILLIAAGVRLIFELLEPVWLYLLAVAIAIAVVRAHWWWRGRL